MKTPNPLISTGTEVVEMLKTKLKSVLFKIISDLEKNPKKLMNKARKSVQDLNKKFNNTDEQFGKEIEILKENSNL